MDRSDRRYKKQQSGAVGEGRDDFRKDHDRLYYTPAFRRLTGVTQVAAPQSETALIHNRYIHSDKVAQIGWALANYVVQKTPVATVDVVGGIEPDVVAAAGLAHDIGHPPFGHAGERVLNRLAIDWGIDGFEGNAQTFRVLTKLAVKDETFPGLDLTCATRNAVLKYPWTFGAGPTPELKARHSRKWCVYVSEVPDFEESRSIHVLPPAPSGEASQSVEATLMELADDISYALHDFEDFYRVGLISIAGLKSATASAVGPKRRILTEVQRALRDHFDFGVAEEAWETVMDWLDNDVFASLRQPYVGASDQDAALVRLTSFQISKFIGGTSIDPMQEHPVVVEPVIEHEIAIWKQMTWQFVINRPGFAAVQTGHAAVMRRTAEALDAWVSDEGIDSPRIPRRLRDYYTLGVFDEDRADYPNPPIAHITARAIVDYLASLTEPQLLVLHDQLTGAWRGSMVSGGIM